MKVLNLSGNALTGSLGDLLETKFECLETILLEDTKLSIHDMQALSRAAHQGTIQNLCTLNLSKNTLTDSIADLVDGKFTKLQNLLLADTMSIHDLRALSKAAMEGRIQNLSTLNLSKNILTDNIEDLIPGLAKTNLETLLLEDTQLSIRDVRSLPTKLFLRTFGLSGNTLTNSISKFLCSGINRIVPELFLDNTELSRKDVLALITAGQNNVLTKWTVLNLSKICLSGLLGYLIHAIRFNSLRSLRLAHTCLRKDDINVLIMIAKRGRLRRLVSLDLSGNALTGSLGDLLETRFECLETFLLEDTKLSVTDVQILSTAVREGKLSWLRTLNVSKNTLAESLRVLLANEFEFLHTLLLEDTRLSMTDVQVLSTAKREGKLPQLRGMNMSKNNLTYSLGVLLANEFMVFDTLLLEDTKLSVTDVQVLSTAAREGKLERLRTLNLSKNSLTDTMRDLFKCRLEYLRELLLEDTQLSISDVRALSMASLLRELRKLNLSKNILTESLVLFLDKKFPHLETLLLEDTGLSTRDILALSTAVREFKLPFLMHLSISHPNVGDLELAYMNLIRRCAIDIKWRMQLKIALGSFGREFQKDVQSICAESRVNVL